VIGYIFFAISENLKFNTAIRKF